MKRVFIAGEIADRMEISGADAHHIMRVLRARAGEEIVVVDGRSRVCRAKFAAFAAETVTLEFVEYLDVSTESPVVITLAQCILKGEKMEFLAQKATELGACALQPLTSENVVVRYDVEKAGKRRERWKKIADESAKQCGRTKLLEVREIAALEDFLTAYAREKGAGHLLLFCYECEGQRKARDLLFEARYENITLLIGPEGGFSLSEAERIGAAGGISVSLGPRILRAETAALAALAAAQFAQGDLG